MDTTSANKPVEGKKFRFVVSSAEEAVKVIREQLGEHARVISVEQVGGKGLARFLSSPQLEVIAMVPSREEIERAKQQAVAAQAPAPTPMPAAPQTSSPPPAASQPAVPSEQRPAASPATARRTYARAGSKPSSEEASGTAKTERKSDEPLTPSGKETLESLLHKARFDNDLITRLEQGTDWKRISKMNLNHGLSEVFYWLRNEYSKVQASPVATRIAFMGTPGCGKTTSLCKRLANDVFVNGKQVQVLKVENDTPNPDDALRVLCDILGVELLRDPVDLGKVNVDGDLYVDVPGVPLHENEQWLTLGKRLDELWIESRVLVINSAYEKEVIKDTISLADRMKCTHLVFTHLDELNNVTKLWPFILNSGLSTLFFSFGQNVTSEFTQDILEFMTTKTFPSYLTH